MAGIVSPGAAAPTPAPRKPPATARRVSLYERVMRIDLGTAAIELLFGRAEVLSEGQRQGTRYFGSTMITFDLGASRDLFREECDAADARRVAELLEKDVRVTARARALATAGATERAGAPLARLDAELRVRSAGARVHVDIDVEGDV